MNDSILTHIYIDEIMEDLNDNLSTKNKRYYMSHVEYIYKGNTEIYKIVGDDVQKISQLVCASNMENARKAVEESLGKDKIFLSIRIDYLVVGD